VKRSKVLVTLLGAVSLLSTACGTGDKIGSVSVTAAGSTGIVNLVGLGGTMQLKVNANYTSGKVIDETNFATYEVTPEGTLSDKLNPLPVPPLGLSINPTGMITATDPAICTWTNNGTLASPSYSFVGDYKIIAHYRGFSSQPLYIPVASGATDQAGQNGQCGATE
jgi:hypothetical protein